MITIHHDLSFIIRSSFYHLNLVAENITVKMMTSNQLTAIARGEANTSFAFSTRNTVEAKWVRQIKMSSPNPNVKKANLSATKKERIELPINYDYDGNCGSKAKAYHISEFLSHPSGIQAMLNTSALQSFHFLDTNTYRCVLPKVQFLNFEAAPVMDLRVTPTDKDCTVQLLSCKFEGSDIVESQNDRFSAFMINHMTWNTNDSESFLEVEVKLKLCLEIYTRPFSLLPISAVERPGNLLSWIGLSHCFYGSCCKITTNGFNRNLKSLHESCPVGPHLCCFICVCTHIIGDMSGIYCHLD